MLHTHSWSTSSFLARIIIIKLFYNEIMYIIISIIICMYLVVNYIWLGLLRHLF